MAEKKVIQIEVDTKNAVKSMDNLADSNRDVSKTFAEVYGEIQPLTTRMGEAEDRLYELASAGQTASQEYKDLLKTVGQYRTTQIQTDLAVDAAATTMNQKLGGALTGVSSGFTLVQGVMGAFGSQSKEVEEALLKVQSAMAIQQGIQGIRESVNSFKALGTAIQATAVFQGIYNLVQTGSIKGLAQSTTAKVVDTEATVAQGTAMVATTAATTGASTAMKVLRAALISTGIGALVVGIGLLIANFDSLKDKFNNLGAPMKMFVRLAFPIIPLIEGIGAVYNYFMADSIALNAKSEASVKKNTKALDAQIKANEKASEALKTKNGHEYNMAKATGASAEALRKLALKHADEVIALDKASLATARNTYEKEKNTLANMRNNDVSDEIIQKQVELVKKSRENVTKEREDLENSYDAKKQIVRNNEVEIATEIFDKKKKIKDNNKTINDQIKADNEKAAEDELNRIKKLNEDITNLNEELRVSKLSDEEKEEDAVAKKYNQKIEDGKKANIDVSNLEKAKQSELTAIRLKYDKIYEDNLAETNRKGFEKRDAEKLKFFELTASESDFKLIKLKADYEAEQLLYKHNQEILTALNKKYLKDKEDLENQELAKKRERTQKGIDMAMSALSVLNDAFQMSVGKSEKDQRRAFRAQKAFNLASAITNTYLAVTGALTAGGNPIKLATGTQFVEAGIAAALGAVQIAKIAGTQFTGGQTASTDTGGGGGGNVPTMSAPQFNVVGQSGINQLASLNQQPIQAYVVSGQVTSQQALDRNRLENATLGG